MAVITSLGENICDTLGYCPDVSCYKYGMLCHVATPFRQSHNDETHRVWPYGYPEWQQCAFQPGNHRNHGDTSEWWESLCRLLWYMLITPLPTFKLFLKVCFKKGGGLLPTNVLRYYGIALFSGERRWTLSSVLLIGKGKSDDTRSIWLEIWSVQYL